MRSGEIKPAELFLACGELGNLPLIPAAHQEHRPEEHRKADAGQRPWPGGWPIVTVGAQTCGRQGVYHHEMSIVMEGMMLKLKLQYFGHFMQRVDSLEKTLML